MTRYIVALTAVLGGSAAAWAGPSDLFPEKVRDFGITPRGPILVHYFRFTNTTGQPLTLGQPRVSCGCVTATVFKYQVAPGETTAVLAQMDTRRIPQGKPFWTVTVYVPFFGTAPEEVSLRVQAACRDDLLMSPDTLAFGTVRKGLGGQVSTKVTLLTDPAWEITGVNSTGGYVRAAHKLEARQANTVTYEVTAVLDKDCPVGNWTSDIFLTTSNPGLPQLRIPVTVAVVSPVAVSPDTVQFGDLALGTPAERRVVVQGTQPFKIVRVNGTDEQVTVNVDTAEAKPVHVLTLSVSPKIVGGFSRTVEILTDSREQPKVTVPVTAQVVGP